MEVGRAVREVNNIGGKGGLPQSRLAQACFATETAVYLPARTLPLYPKAMGLLKISSSVNGLYAQKCKPGNC